MGNGGNPTALRTGGGTRLAGQRTVNAINRLRGGGGGGLAGIIGRARANNRAAARRRARRG